MSSRESYMKLDAWIDVSVTKVKPGNSIHIHADELFPDVVGSPQATLDLLASSYIRTIEILSGRLEQVMPVLVIPLRDAQELVCEPPPSSGLSGDLSTEPPSISLVHRDTARLPRLRESYRRFLSDFHMFDRPMPNVKFVYECSRSEEERIQGWEYTRTIFGEHYPNTVDSSPTPKGGN
jgi:hypothetical protein